jgi:hypothetical protein
MSTQVDIQITDKDMYRFNMHHAYTGFQGIFATVIGLLVLVVAGLTWGRVSITYSVLYVVFGIVFLIYTPVALKSRSKRQMLLSPVLKEPMHYTFDEAGVHVAIGEEQADLEWKMIYKMISTGKQLLIYSTRINAYILPLEQVQEQYPAIKELAEKNLEPFRCKFK